ncbi:MAG TPA: hypothetical protein VFI20_02710 [Terracidiphilus sp.]|nr:hypothetical protein [Terracidiphilus sp.]
MRRIHTRISVLVFVFALGGYAQSWNSILNSSQAINWSNSGVGGIPARTTVCTNLTSSATVSQINSALSSCPSGQTVLLGAGTYNINGTISVPSNVTLRGAGANQTILNATGGGGGAVVSLGSGQPSYSPVTITGGATTGSTTITVSSASSIKTGMYLVITETNSSSYVSSAGSEGNCSWCDAGWSNGSLARGQIVAVMGVSGSNVTIAPGLYSAYTNSPVAVPFNMSASYAGVENLQVYANNTGYGTNFAMSACAYCWVKGVESNYTDGDHVEVYWGYRDEIRDNYFSNAFLHSPGTHDSCIQIGLKTSASLIENNIVERAHQSVILEWGAAGNVISYNYTEGEFDSGATNVVIGGIDFHGAHPQFNLLEGNMLTSIYGDSVWGTSSHTTAFRNWVVGTNRICSPTGGGRGTVSCASGSGHYGFQAARAIQMSYLSTYNNFVGNVIGSAQMQSLTGYGTLAQTVSVEYPATRSYDSSAYGWTFGYGEASDDGTGSGCAGGTSPCHRSGTSATDFIDGNFNNIGGAITWASGASQTLPASFYLSGKPSWWASSIPYPATGPDVTGGSGPGGHSYGNPAYNCFVNVMHGTDGGGGGPYSFNANQCYGDGAGSGTGGGTGTPPASTGPAPPTNLTATPVQQ